jgi:uncharacterized membrane protein
MTVLVALHVAAAVFLIGPLTYASSISPRAVRQGTEGLGALRLLCRTTWLYTVLSLIVVALGLALVRRSDGFGFNQFWISASLTLYVVAVGVLLLVVVRDQRAAIARIEAGEDPAVHAARIAAGSGVAALIWLAVVFLMVFKPGG